METSSHMNIKIIYSASHYNNEEINFKVTKFGGFYLNEYSKSTWALSAPHPKPNTRTLFLTTMFTETEFM